MRTWYVEWVLGVVLAMGTVAAAGDQCTYGGRFYGPGAMSCQDGAQAQCVGGTWKPTGLDCGGDAGDPSGEEDEPGVVEPPVVEPRAVEPGVGSAAPPQVPPVGD